MGGRPASPRIFKVRACVTSSESFTRYASARARAAVPSGQSQYTVQAGGASSRVAAMWPSPYGFGMAITLRILPPFPKHQHDA
jgi:hypothetical protein